MSLSDRLRMAHSQAAYGMVACADLGGFLAKNAKKNAKQLSSQCLFLLGALEPFATFARGLIKIDSSFHSVTIS